ncbi:unnamed protein product [Prunus brigantina]
MGGSTMLGGGATEVARSGRGSGRWHGGERWWCHHVDRGIVGGVALGRRGFSHRGGFASRLHASNHGCLEGFGGLKNRRNGFLEHALSITRALNESTNLFVQISPREYSVAKIPLSSSPPPSPCKIEPIRGPHPGGVGQRPSDA